MRHSFVRHHITIEHGGKQITGAYTIDKRGAITVWYGGDFKSAHGGPAADAIAKMVLRELATKRDNDQK
jgi:hypothetical protein